MARGILWMTHGHRPQQAALLSVRRTFGREVETIGSRADGRLGLVPADVALSEPEDDLAFVEFLETTARRRREIHGAVPVVVIAMRRRRRLVEHTAALAAAGIVLLAGSMSGEALDLCEDKGRFAGFMAESFPLHALPTWVASDSTTLDQAIREIERQGRDACVKPPIGVFGRGFWHLSPSQRVSSMFTGDPEFEERRMISLDLFRTAYALDPEPLVVMPFMAGAEVSIDALFREGTLIRAATRRKIGSLQAIGDNAETILPAMRAIGERLGLNGVVNLQVIQESRAKDGPFKVLEINTRYSGGSTYLLEAGLDLFSEAMAGVLGISLHQRLTKMVLDVAIRAEPASQETHWGAEP